MSSYACETCGALHNDTPQGYISSCKCNPDNYHTLHCDACKAELTEVPGHNDWLWCKPCTEKQLKRGKRG